MLPVQQGNVQQNHSEITPYPSKERPKLNKCWQGYGERGSQMIFALRSED